MQETSVKLLQYAIASSGILRIDHIGSGIGIIFYSSLQKTGAGLHILAPQSTSMDPKNPIMYADTAIPFILDRLASMGIHPPFSVAVAGGACMLGKEDAAKAGLKVADAVRHALADARLPIKLDQTGGNMVRSMILDIDAGRIKIS
jgi:chemotaxis protein CheD